MMEDLEVNPLHRAFLTKFRRDFEVACRMSYLVVIPFSDSLESHTIDQYFANSHILIPSKLLKMHYNQLQMGNFEDIEVENKKLICHRNLKNPSDKLIVNIIAEEIGYNMFSKEYRTVLVDRPLVFNIQPRQIMIAFKGILAPLSPRSPSATALAKRQRAHLINSRTLTHQDDCAKYLEFISQELTVRLEIEIRRLQSNYIILSHYLPDASKRTRDIADRYVEKYELILETSFKGRLEICEIIQKSIRLSVENYVVYLMHGKLMATIHDCYEREDSLLAEKFNLLLASRLTICQLGARKEFSAFEPDDDLLRLLRRMPNLQSPLAMVCCLMNAIDRISENLNQSVRFKRLLGDSSRDNFQLEAERLMATSAHGPTDPIPICSDDLIASFVYCLPQARPNNLYSMLRYLELFGWHSVEKDQSSYYLATFETSVEYILNFTNSSSLSSSEEITD
uniref:VPS9 domain-containing protein n=1 Tax=Aceria tosichella TaxID=561515 RepID=A0A6G1SBP1_9ACAR